LKTLGHPLTIRLFLAFFLCAQLLGGAPFVVAGEMSVLVDQSGPSLDDSFDGKDCNGLTSAFCFVGADRQGHRPYGVPKGQLRYTIVVAASYATGPPHI